MNIRSLYPLLRPVYLVPRDDIANGIFIPTMGSAHSVRCMAGFFNSSSFAQLAPGLAAFVNQSRGALQLLISPPMGDTDRQAIEAATVHPTSVLKAAALQLLEDGLLSESALARHSVQCLAFLLANRRAEIRLVHTSRGIFRPKVWIILIDHSFIVAHGSSKATEPGLLCNYETVSVERSWVETGKANFFSELFDGIWNGTDPTTLTIDMPQGLALIKNQAEGVECPTVDDYWEAWHDDAANGLAPPLPDNVALPTAFQSIG